MKHKIIFICATILVCFLSNSCNPNPSSIPLIRTYSEYKDLSEEEKLNLIATFDRLSSEDLKEEIHHVTQKYILSQESIACQIKNIELTKENLLLASNKNRKIRSNGALRVDFLLDDEF